MSAQHPIRLLEDLLRATTASARLAVPAAASCRIARLEPPPGGPWSVGDLLEFRFDGEVAFRARARAVDAGRLAAFDVVAVEIPQGGAT